MPEPDNEDSENPEPPENWERIRDSRYQNECGLWLIIAGTTVKTWVGNSMFPLKGTVNVIGQFETETRATEVAHQWMEENPNPWGDTDD